MKLSVDSCSRNMQLISLENTIEIVQHTTIILYKGSEVETVSKPLKSNRHTQSFVCSSTSFMYIAGPRLLKLSPVSLSSCVRNIWGAQGVPELHYRHTNKAPGQFLRTVCRLIQCSTKCWPNRAISIFRWWQHAFYLFFFPSKGHFHTLPSTLKASRSIVKWNGCFWNCDKMSSLSFLVWVVSFMFQLLLHIPGLSWLRSFRKWSL